MIDDAIKWHRHDGVLAQNIYLNTIFGWRPRWSSILNVNQLVFEVGVVTNGTTPVNFFSDNNNITSYPFRIVGATATALDTTAGTISVKNNADTVLTLAKGTVSGAVVGNTSVNSSFWNVSSGASVTAVSSSAGNVLLFIKILFPFN